MEEEANRGCEQGSEGTKEGRWMITASKEESGQCQVKPIIDG